MGWGRSLLWGLIVAVASMLLWQAFSTPQPQLQTSDLYTHLSVTRHLARGEGFLTDVTYPLSFAFPFARELPQPLIHRQPGFPVLLQIPYATAGGDPHLTLVHTRIMQMVILGLILLVGSVGYLRLNLGRAVLPWIIFILVSPLVKYAVDWGSVELVCSLVLLVIWLRGRSVRMDGPGPVDGLLVGLLAYLRFDLFWVPWLWFFWWRSERHKESPGQRFFNLRLLGAALVFVLLMVPWSVRNLRLTGQPFFSLQTSAEMIKMTPIWPDYSVYKQLEPQPLVQTLQKYPKEVATKVVHGLWFFLKNHHRFMPWFLFWAGAIPAAVLSFALFMQGLALVLFRKHIPGASIIPEKLPAGPNCVAFLTLTILMLQYSFFDHDLRHLLVMLPIVLWESTTLVGTYAQEVAQRSKASWDSGPSQILAGFIGLVMALVIVLTMPCKLPGWEYAALYSKNQAGAVASRIAFLKANPVDVLFDDTAAVPWFVDQPAVWTPADEETRNIIREYLAR